MSGTEILAMPGYIGPTNRRSQRRNVSASYDAAQTTSENAAHWRWADYLSADAATRPEVRRVLRARARYEYDNNSYCKGMCWALARWVVGTGPSLQVVSSSARFNAAVEWQWGLWCKAVDLTSKLCLTRVSVARDGEAFLSLATNPRLEHDVKLDLKPIDADRVQAPYGATATAGDGVVYDDWDNPLAYNVLRNHPGTLHLVGSPVDCDTIPAEAMVHMFVLERAGQLRGVPQITQAIPLFAQLRRYTLAVIAAAEGAANMSGVIKTQSSPVEPGAIEPMDEIEIPRSHWLTLPEGWDATAFKAEQPATTYGSFKREILNEIGRTLDLPYNIAAGDSSQYNYASGRLDHQSYIKAVDQDRQRFADRLLLRTFFAWLREAMLIPNLLPPMPHEGIMMLSWYWPGHEHVDPSKEATADDKRLSNGTLTIPSYFARRGLDWEREQEAAARSLGLPLDEYRRRLAAKLLGPAPTEQQHETEPAVPVDEEDDDDEA